IAVAKDKLKGEEIEFIIADAEEVKLDGTFDLIISNAVFQWFPNLDTSLSRYRELMSEGGAIIFSSFGPKTFFELGLVIKDALGPRNSSMTSHSFLGLDDIKSSLRAKFNDTYFEKRIYRRLYISLSELFDDIRYSGTRGLGVRSGGVWTKRTVNAVEESYKKRFGRIIATYEIFFCRGIK
ncbi:MAG: methyltransferase domain-containing protein, partial [Candidatus Omnitrophica bacterium]|nr:methyltransferase domain-containing protein [Candidatus Omnitrophota bacterium]